MITSIKLKNFKCFDSLDITLSALNVFAGMNGAGKSTAIQSLLALRQSGESGLLRRNRLQLNGSLAELGAANEVYCAEPNSDWIELSFYSEALSRELEIKTQYAESNAKLFFLYNETDISEDVENFELFREPFNYLHAERIGPRKTSSIPPPDQGDALHVGKNGEFAPYLLASEYQKQPVGNKVLWLEGIDDKIRETLHYQCPLWMGKLFPGYEKEDEIYLKADQVRHGLSLQKGTHTGQSLFVRPTNTGFGLSYSLGIIVAGLIAKPESILIVENPEAHLHPRAQSTIGEFLARVAAGGTQVFVETHSEHVLNGMRRVIKNGVLNHQLAKVHFFANSHDSFFPTVTEISISDTGEMSTWPSGFFDQLDEDLSKLYI